VELVKLLESVSLEGSDPTVALEVMATDGLVCLTSRGKRRVLHVERLTMKEACDLVAILRIATRKTSGKPQAAASAG
jgi:hypothetical protein